MTDPRYVTVCPGARIELNTLSAALRASGRPARDRVVAYAQIEAEYQQRLSDHRAAVELVLRHDALAEPFVTAAVRVTVDRVPGVSADIDWPAANELLRQWGEPASGSDLAAVWRTAFATATRHWNSMRLSSPNRPAEPPPASPEPAGDADHLQIGSGAWVTREAIHDGLRRWAQDAVDAPDYALEAERFHLLYRGQRDAVEQLIEADAIRDEFLSRTVAVSIRPGAVHAYVSWQTARALLTGKPSGPTTAAWRNACAITAQLV